MRAFVFVALLATACTDTYDFDPATAGEADADRAPRAKNSSQFVRTIYADLLGRSPESYDFVLRFEGVSDTFRIPLDEEAQLVTTLEGIGDSQPMRNLIANGLLSGDEITLPAKSAVDAREFISEQFRRLLGREPNPYELQLFVNEWTTDSSVGPKAIIRAIIGSREYQSQ